MPTKDYYKTLNIAHHASLADIKRSYHKLMREYHPDKAKDNPNATEKTKELVEAYEVLSNENKRRVYDLSQSHSGVQESKAVDPAAFRPHNNLEKSVYHDCIEKETDLKARDILAEALAQNIALRTFRYDSADRRAYSLLNLAVLKQAHAVLRLLVSAGLDPNHLYTHRQFSNEGYRSDDYEGRYAKRSALQDAIEMADEEMIKILCSSQLVPLGSFGFTFSTASIEALHMFTAIATHLNEDSFKRLLSQYDDYPAAKNQLLLVAVLYDNRMALKALLEAQANPNKQYYVSSNVDNGHIIPMGLEGTALIAAVRYGRLDCASILLEHKADPNLYFRERGDYEKYGKGDSPLIIAMQELAREKNHGASRAHTARKKMIKQFNELPKAKSEDYHKIIELLINRGADVGFTSGRNSFPKLVTKYLETNADAFLEQWALSTEDTSEKQQKAKKYHHESYALLSQLNAKNQEECLIMEIKDQDGNTRWDIPGGQANYQKDNDLLDTVIHLTAYQLGINLLDLKPETTRHTLSPEQDDDIVEIRHYHLDNTIQSSMRPSFNRLINERSPDTLEAVHFVKLEDLKINFVDYQGIVLPLCTYKNKPLPYLLGLKIAILRKITGFDVETAEKLAFKLHYSAQSLFDKAIREGNVSAIDSLIQLKIQPLLNLDYSLGLALESNNPSFIQHLLNIGVLFENESQMTYYLSKHQDLLSEESFLLLFEAHKDMIAPSSNLVKNFVVIVEKRGFANLLDRLLALDKNHSKEIAKHAFEHYNFDSLKLILSKVAVEDKDELIEALLKKSNFYHSTRSQDLQALFKMLPLLFEQYSKEKIADKNLLSSICHLYTEMVEQNIDPNLLEECLRLINDLIDRNYFEQSSSVFNTLFLFHASHGESPAFASFLAVLKKIPFIAEQFAAFETEQEKNMEVSEDKNSPIDLIPQLTELSLNGYQNNGFFGQVDEADEELDLRDTCVVS